MKRIIYQSIERYDKEAGKRIFLLYGCPNVGKTYLVFDYVKKNYQNYLYIDFGNNSVFKNNIKDFSSLCSYFSISENDIYNVPVIIDNMTEIDLLEGLKSDLYRCPKLFITTDRTPNMYSAFETELLFVSLRILPFSFKEFLWATGHEWYADIIKGHLENRKKIPEMIHVELMDIFDVYFSTGGMPEIIEEYSKLDNISCLANRKKHLNDAVFFSMFENDANSSKIYGITSAVKNIYQKTNRKFMYSEIRKGVSEALYLSEIEQLVNRGFLYRINRLGNDMHEITKDFRLYFYDFGIITNNDNMLNNSLDTSENAVIENYILETINSSDSSACYYESGKGAVVDFVLKYDDNYIPLDIKLAGFKRSISVQNFSEQNNISQIIQIGKENYIFEDYQKINSKREKITVPIYAFEELLYELKEKYKSTKVEP